MKIIQTIDRILWATRMASLTSPTFLGSHTPGGETAPVASPLGDDRARSEMEG